ncbi:MAG TPA: glycosyltransferase family A protein [Gemmata sp.]|jgi:glycosyltransferase involved in cell wall biosynthesis|nr:glycosyltransferase family A protein [Gemmata sp.]
MSEATRVTLVVPSYRRGAKIGPTLASALAQTRVPDEVVVVNDGGFAETSEYVRREFPSVRVLDIPHGGAAVARNTGVASATHPIVVLIDDDDTFRPEGIEVLLRTLTTFPEARAAHGDNSYTNLGTGEHRERNNCDIPSFAPRFARVKPLKESGGVRLYGKALYYEMLRGNILQQPWIVYRDAYLAVGGFQSGLVSADDWDLYLRIVRRFPVALTDELIGHQYTEPDRPHLTTDPRQREGQMEAARRQLALAGWWDPRAALSLRRTLAGHHKSIGDAARGSDSRAAWRAYLRSFAYWPFDLVVAARALVVLPLERLLRSRRPSKPETT